MIDLFANARPLATTSLRHPLLGCVPAHNDHLWLAGSQHRKIQTHSGHFLMAKTNSFIATTWLWLYVLTSPLGNILPIRRKCCFLVCGFLSKSFEWKKPPFNNLSVSNILGRHTKMQTKLKYFLSKTHNFKHAKHHLVWNCSFFGSIQSVITCSWYFHPPTHRPLTLWLPSWQVQPRRRQPEYSCSTLKQPPQQNVSGNNEQIYICTGGHAGITANMEKYICIR